MEFSSMEETYPLKKALACTHVPNNNEDVGFFLA